MWSAVRCHNPTHALQQRVPLLNHLVGDREQSWRDFNSESACRLQVDGELEFGRLLHRHIGGLRSLQDFAGIDSDLIEHVREVGSVAHQPAGGDKITIRVTRRYLVARCQRGKLPSPADEECVGRDEQRIGMLGAKSSKGGVDLADRTRIQDLDLEAEGGGRLLHVVYCVLRDGDISRVYLAQVAAGFPGPAMNEAAGQRRSYSSVCTSGGLTLIGCGSSPA
jgi:hypothetical protein